MNHEKVGIEMVWQESVKVWESKLPADSDLSAELVTLKENEKNLAEAFSSPLSFGTAGMRGVMGPGINRMNVYTVRQATAGLATLIVGRGEAAKQRGVVISYDSRHHSREFALESAKVLVAQGIKAYVFSSLRPTPELSFAVRELKTEAGIMITASHNPPMYNGYKCYGADGGQLPPEAADIVTEAARKVDLFDVPVVEDATLAESSLFRFIDDEIDSAYLDKLKTVTVNKDVIKEHHDIKIVYTPLHGTGQYLMEKVFANAGFTGVHYVASQKDPDGDFTTVKSPNPEDAPAFVEAEKVGTEVNADVLIATDPDADRMGVAIRKPDGAYQLLTGNQIGAILLDYLLRAKKEQHDLPANGAVVKSVVSSELATAVAESYGVEMFNVLTGFKFIAEKIHQFETEHDHEFLFGYEESYGFLIKPFVRDKDALQASLLLAEVAAGQKAKGKTLADALDNLYDRFGVHLEKTIAKTFPGSEGLVKMKELMASFHEAPLTEINGVEVESVSDILHSVSIEKSGKTTPLSLPKSDVLKYHLANGDWVALRPSGTEPKMKLYIGVTADTKEKATEKLQAYEASLSELFN